MSFLAPVLLLLGALALPVVVAFLSRKKMERRVVPSLVIFKHIESGVPRSKNLGVPRNLLALLLYLLALVFAASQPVFEGEEPRDVVIVLDASYSMSARHEGFDVPHIDIARARIEEEILEHLGPRDRASLIVADVYGRVVVEPTRDVGAHREALAKVEPSGLGRHVDAAMRLGAALCQGSEREKRELVIVTDGFGLSDRLPEPVATCPTRLMLVADATTPREALAAKVPPANIAISALVARQIDALGEHEVYVEVLNASPKAEAVAVELDLDGVVVDVLSLEVGANARVGRVFELSASDGDILHARIAREGGGEQEEGAQEDAFTLDDEAFTILQEIAPVDALIITSREFSFVQQAFRLHPRVRVVKIAPGEVTRAVLRDKQLVLVEDRVEGLDLAASLDPGATLWWLGPDSASGETFGEEIERPVLGWWRFDDEIFRYVDLDDVEVLTASPIKTLPEDDVLIRAGQDQALMLRRALPDAKSAFISAFHPEESDLVLRMAFVNLIANMVEWVAKTIDLKTTYALSPGEVFFEVGEFEHLEPVSSGVARMTRGEPASQLGVWAIQGGAHQGELVVVGFDEMSESQFRRDLEALDARSTPFDAEAFARGDQGARLIRWLLLLAFVAMIIEGLWLWWRSRQTRGLGAKASSESSRLREELEGQEVRKR